MPHEEPPHRTDAVDQPQAQVARETQRGEVVREQPVQSVRRRRQREKVEAPPAFVALQDIERADIEAEPGGVENDVGQRGGVFQPEINPWPASGWIPCAASPASAKRGFT